MLHVHKLDNAIRDDHCSDVIEQTLPLELLECEGGYMTLKHQESKDFIARVRDIVNPQAIDVDFENKEYKVKGKVHMVMLGEDIVKACDFAPTIDLMKSYPVQITSAKLEKSAHKDTLRNNAIAKRLKVRLACACQAFDVSHGFVVFRSHPIEWAMVRFEQEDQEFIEKAREAARWAHNVSCHYHEMTLSPPSHPELYPNMNGDEAKHRNQHVQDIKKKLAHQNGEITMVLHLGTKDRKTALSKGITTWKDDRLTADLLGISKKTKKYRQVNKVLHINRGADPVVDVDAIPKLARSEDMYVDFETSGMYQYASDYLFMIGYATVSNDSFVGLVVSEPTLEEEARIFQAFVDEIRAKKIKRLLHWAPHEKNVCVKLKARHGIEIPSEVKWIDLRAQIEASDFLPKGAFDYKLKSVAKAMYSHNMIQTVWQSSCQDGLTAMYEAYEAYRTEDKKMLNDILDYNRVDVVTMMEIWKYLQSIQIDI